VRAVPDLPVTALGDDRDARTHELFQARDDASDSATLHCAVSDLVELHLPLARSIANRYRTQHGDHADLVQVAYLGLVKAVLRFRADVGAPFVSFAVPTITGEVRRHFRDHAWDIRPPRNLQELRPDVDRASQELTQELGRTPSVGQIAERLGIAVRDVTNTQRAVSTGLNMHSLEALTDSAPSLSLRETIGAPDHELELVTERLSLRPLVAALPERDRSILVLRFAEGYTQRQIASELHLSQTQVCRLLTRILHDLREQLEDPVLDGQA
jgi:RNA polymerase sigma-B factor